MQHKQLLEVEQTKQIYKSVRDKRLVDEGFSNLHNMLSITAGNVSNDVYSSNTQTKFETETLKSKRHKYIL